MKRLVNVLGVVFALAVAVPAGAQTVPAPTYVFTTVDAVRAPGSSYVHVTGVQEGAAGATEVSLYFPYSSTTTTSRDSCERYALIAMDKPGRYKLEFWSGSGGYCRLSRVNP